MRDGSTSTRRSATSRPICARSHEAGPDAPVGHRAPPADDGRGPAAGRPLGRPPDGRGQRLGRRGAVRARRDALARARHAFRVLQLQLGGARARGRDGHGPALPGRRERARAAARSVSAPPSGAPATCRPSRSRRATARPARASRPRCRWPTAATSRRSAGSTAACATWRAGAACSSNAEPAREAPEDAPVARATLREMQRARSAFRPSVEWPSLAEPPGVVAGGYGYGLMIWHERDGQRHVGHPGGLPGFGTLMRWVPELGLGVILLANVTYAKCEAPVRRALELVAREAALPRRIVRADPGLLAARDGGRAGSSSAGTTRRPGGCSRATSTSIARWPSAGPRSRRCASATARCGATASSSTTTRCAAAGACAASAGTSIWRSRSRRPCRRSCRRSSVESVLPPSGALAGLADAAARLASEPAADALERAARARRRRRGGAARPAGRRRALRPVRRARGRSPATARRRSTLRLPGARGAVELELELDEAGRAPGALLVLRPAGLTEPF